VIGTVAGIIAIIVAVLYLKRPAEIRIEGTPRAAELLVDGRRIDVGRTPTVIRDLTPNVAHTVEIRKTGYRVWTTRLELRSGQVLRLPPVTLIPDLTRPRSAQNPEAQP
jgi:hypothetical protein